MIIQKRTGIPTLCLWLWLFIATCLLPHHGHTTAWWGDAIDLMIAVPDKQAHGAPWDAATTAEPFHFLPASTTASPTLPDIMLCIVAATGEVECHHQEGILTGHTKTPGHSICRGGEAQLNAYCQDTTICFLRHIAVPKDIFGLLLLEITPPVHGLAQHRVIDGLVIVHTTTDQAMVAYESINRTLHALAQCLAPTQRLEKLAAPFPLLLRTACEDHLCTLEHSSLWLVPQIKTTARLR